MNPSTLTKSEPGYKNLIAVAAVLEATSKHGAMYTVEDVYFDFGQNWLWTTICRSGWEGCQAINPRQWENIILAMDEEDLFKAVKDIKSGRYFDD